MSNKTKISIRNTNWIENLCLIFPVVKNPASKVAFLFNEKMFILREKGTINNKQHKMMIK